jgi:adenylate cyclase
MSGRSAVAPEQNMTAERLKNLYELIRRMNSVYDLPDLLDFVVDRVLNMVGGKRALLLLHNQDAGKPLNVAVVRGERLNVVDVEQVIEFVSSTVIKDVLEKGETRLVHDLPADTRYEKRASSDTLQLKAVRSVLAVPLIAESRQIGLLYIDHPHRAAFGQDELDYLNAFANQAALAIHRAQEHEQQVRELTLLNELSRSLVQVLDLNEVLTRIVTEVTLMLNVEASSVLLLNKAGDTLEFATSVHKGKPLTIPTTLKRDEGIAGWVITHEQPLFVNNVHEEPRWFGEVGSDFETRSLLCVPLQMEGRAVGVLEALNKRDGVGFSSGDITLLSAFAASAAIAIKNARLFQEARQARQLRALNKVAMTLSGTLDLEKILTEGLAHSLTMLNAAAGAVSLQDAPTHTDLLTVKVTPELLPVENKTIPQAVGRLATWLQARPGSSDNDENVLIVDELHPPAPALAPLLIEIAALAAAPIKVQGRIGGVLVVASTTPHTYSLEAISLLNGVARIIELAAQNAIHYLQVQAQTVHLKYLNQIGSVLTSSLDIDHVLRVIIDGVNTLLQTELTSVFLIDPDTNELVLRYTTKGDADIRLPAPGRELPVGWPTTISRPW